MTTITTETPYFTVEQASRWLTCAQPVPLPLLQRLGKDCSMVCRIRGATFIDVPVQGKSWPTERGYPAAIIQEVFLANPETRPFLPGAAPAPKPAPTRAEMRIADKWLADAHAPLLVALQAWALAPLTSPARVAAWQDVERYLVEQLP